jgi:hypothetical protein
MIITLLKWDQYCDACGKSYCHFGVGRRNGLFDFCCRLDRACLTRLLRAVSYFDFPMHRCAGLRPFRALDRSPPRRRPPQSRTRPCSDPVATLRRGLAWCRASTRLAAKLGRITKMGDQYLRKLLIGGMTVVIRSARRTKAPTFVRVNALLERRPTRLVSVALANKTARAFAILIRGETYRAPTIARAAA